MSQNAEPAASTADTAALCATARARRDAAWGRRLTFSPKVFLPITNLCRNRCSYCSFRRSPGEPGEWTMHPDEVRGALDLAAAQGCTEALLCLGDTPETSFPEYHALLGTWGHRSTVDYLVAAAELALARGILPHTNAGILTRDEMCRLRPVNVSLGLMLETTAERLSRPGGPHARAPDKLPARRLAMIREAGELGIPFTTGILVGIGETEAERVDALVAIRDLHRRYGHIQEVIVQPFRCGPHMAWDGPREPGADDVARAIALARTLLDDEVSVQSPPNLEPASIRALLDAGINDLGGISPVTPDYINPSHPWPMLAGLAREATAGGFTLAPRLPVYPRWAGEPRFLDPRLHAPLARAPEAWARLSLEAA